MFSDLKDFDYEAPDMQYDKKTGEINIIEKKAEKKGSSAGKKIIANIDDLEKEKKALFAEMGLDESGKPKNAKEPEDKIAEKLKTVQDRINRDFEIDPSSFTVFSRDFMRVDVGLMI